MEIKRIYITGFSLVEIMVAMVIGLFLSTGLFTMFNMSLTNIKSTSGLNQLQENGRMALAILTDDISQAGFFADMTGNAFSRNNTTNNLSIDAYTNCIGGGLNNANFPNGSQENFRFLWGYEIGKSTNNIICGSLDLVGISNTDVVQIKRLSGPNIELSNPSNVINNRIYMTTTANQAVLFSSEVTPYPLLEQARSWIYKHHIYYIANDTDGIPALRRKGLTGKGMENNEQLVAGIENMRVLYGIDTTSDRSVNAFLPESQVTDAMWDNKGSNSIIAVRIYLLVRAIEADPKYINSVTYTLGDKTIAAKNDHYRRVVLSATVPVKNATLS